MSTVLVFSLVGCGGDSSSKEEINLMTWGGDFIPNEIISDFEKETGIKINYKEVTSNEDMQTLLETNPDQYDLAVVTDYMVDIMVKNDYLESLDKDSLSNFSNINPVYQNNYYDENNEYSMPYAISTAFLSKSTPTTDSAPNLADTKDNIPLPVPTSYTFCPFSK